MRAISCLLILAIVLFFSCSKPDSVGYRFNQTMPPSGYFQPDSLTGKEFQFDSLIWIPDDNWGYTAYEMENINFFSNPNRNISIILKEDSSAFWVPVVRAANFQYHGFVYAIGSGTLFIRPVPINTSMIGKYFSIRVTFL